jgi:AcrR family transcriptional regulator
MGNAIVIDTAGQAPAEAKGNALQAAQREATRDRLVDGAIRVFTRKGYAASVVADVLKEAQVSRASFYAHFSSMQALVVEIADRFAPVWLPHYASLAQMPGKTGGQLQQWCAQMVRFYRDNEAICVILAHAMLLDQEIYGKTAHYQEVLLDLLADGEPRLAHVRGDPDARLRVGLVLSQLDRSCYYLGVRRFPQDPAAGVEIMADQLHHFLQGEMARAGT